MLWELHLLHWSKIMYASCPGLEGDGEWTCQVHLGRAVQPETSFLQTWSPVRRLAPCQAQLYLKGAEDSLRTFPSWNKFNRSYIIAFKASYLQTWKKKMQRNLIFFWSCMFLNSTAPITVCGSSFPEPQKQLWNNLVILSGRRQLRLSDHLDFWEKLKKKCLSPQWKLSIARFWCRIYGFFALYSLLC